MRRAFVILLAILSLFLGWGGKGEAAITQHPRDVTVTVGGTASFNSNATGLIWPNLTWEISVPGTGGFRRADYVYQVVPEQRNNTITGTNTYNLRITNIVAGMDGAQVRLRIQETLDGLTKTWYSNIARITIGTPPPPPPSENLSITTQPQSQSVEVGRSAGFSVEVWGGGGAYTYQWERASNMGDFTAVEDWSGSGTTWNNRISYVFTNAQASNNGDRFRCVVTSGSNSVTSDVATLTVTDGSGTTPPPPPSGGDIPQITSHPSAQMVSYGETATFKISASGSDLSYMWQILTPGSSAEWTDMSILVDYYGSTGWASGIDTDTLRIKTKVEDGGLYFRCVVQNSAGSATSRSAGLAVLSYRYESGGGGCSTGFEFLAISIITLAYFYRKGRSHR